MEVSSFAAGCIAGAAGQLVGHPLDTIKVYAQTVGTTAKPIAWSVLMRGVAAPVASGVDRDVADDGAYIVSHAAYTPSVRSTIVRHFAAQPFSAGSR